MKMNVATPFDLYVMRNGGESSRTVMLGLKLEIHKPGEAYRSRYQTEVPLTIRRQKIVELAGSLNASG